MMTPVENLLWASLAQAAQALMPGVSDDDRRAAYDKAQRTLKLADSPVLMAVTEERAELLCARVNATGARRSGWTIRGAIDQGKGLYPEKALPTIDACYHDAWTAGYNAAGNAVNGWRAVVISVAIDCGVAL
jgi:hypothetical protein